MRIVPDEPWIQGTIENKHDGTPVAPKRPGMPYSPGGQPLEPFQNPTEFVEYMTYPEVDTGNFVGPSSGAVNAANLMNASTQESPNTADTIDRTQVDMAEANGCYDSADKGEIAYGNPNTGRPA